MSTHETPASDDALGRDPLVGERLGPYRLLSRIGAGGMATVYLGVDEALQRRAAVKVLSMSSPPLLARFLAEARSQAQLDHPNIVPVYGAGTEMVRGLEVYYIALKYIDGYTLAERVREQGPCDPEVATRMLLETARGLQFAHDRGFVHRDVKPGNVLIDRTGRALVADFGLVRDQSRVGQPVTRGEFVGTRAYASPEQLRKEPVDARSDIYSLGATYLFLLTGLRPGQAEAPDASDASDASGGAGAASPPAHPEDARRLPPIDPALPQPVRALLTQLLRDDPRERPQTMGECIALLEKVLWSLEHGEEEERAARRASRRRSALLFASAAAGLLLVLTLTGNAPWKRDALLAPDVALAAVPSVELPAEDAAEHASAAETSAAPPETDARSALQIEIEEVRAQVLETVDAYARLVLHEARVPGDDAAGGAGGAGDARGSTDADRAPVAFSLTPAPALDPGGMGGAVRGATVAPALPAALGEAELERSVDTLLVATLGQLDRRAQLAADRGARQELDRIALAVAPRLAAALRELAFEARPQLATPGLAAIRVDRQLVMNLQYFAFLAQVRAEQQGWRIDRLRVDSGASPHPWVAMVDSDLERPRFDVCLEPVLSLSGTAIDAYCRFTHKRLPTQAEWEVLVAPRLLAGDGVARRGFLADSDPDRFLPASEPVVERVLWDGEPYFAFMAGDRPVFRFWLNVSRSQQALRLVE